MTCECKGCTERTIYCHTSCEKYAKYLKEIEEMRKNRNKARFADIVSNESLSRAISDKYEKHRTSDGYSLKRHSRKGMKI